MSLDTIMNLSITVEDRAPTQEGFGTPLLYGYHTAWLDRLVQEYSTADEMLDDGFTTDDALYLAARIVKSQDPSPGTFKIGRRVQPLTQVVTIEPTVTTQGFKYKGTIGGKALSYTNGAAETTTTIATALASAITALAAGTTAVAAASVVTCTAGTPGAVVSFDLGAGMKIADATTDTSTDDELPELLDEDGDWYGLAIVDSLSKATTLNAAAWIESIRKQFIFQTADTDTLDSVVTDDIGSQIMASKYARTNGIYHRAIGGNEWLAAGWLAGILTTTPGSATPAFKEVKGVKTDNLLQSHENTLGAKNLSTYTLTGGLGITFEGKAGDGGFIDTVRFIDWVYARMRERVLATLAGNPKIPYTDAGVDVMRAAILAVIQDGIKAGGFAPTPEPVVTAPRVKDVDPALRIKRILPDLKWKATLAGAIHRLNPVTGSVAV